jgi:hypothetical protein
MVPSCGMKKELHRNGKTRRNILVLNHALQLLMLL